MMLRGPVSALWDGLPEVLDAGRPVDRVELKVLLDGDLENALAVLGPEVDPPRVRRVHYLDTPDLALLGRGVVVRARVTGTAGAPPREDVVVKLRRPAPPGSRRWNRFPLELDALPDEVAWAACVRRRLPAGSVQRAMGRRRPARHLLDKAQRNLLRSVLGAKFDPDTLTPMGPVEALRLTAGRPGDRIGVELWTLPDGTRLLELSAKCRPSRCPQMTARVRDLIAHHGIALADRQTTKTRMALRCIAGLAASRS